jgi:hypothetical protein
MGRYLRHDAVGAEEVAAGGGSRLAVAWTAGHHHPPAFGPLDGLAVPGSVTAALAAADHDH